MSELLQAMLILMVSLACTLLAVCLALTHSMTHWHAASWIALLILCTLPALWYERRLRAPASES